MRYVSIDTAISRSPQEFAFKSSCGLPALPAPLLPLQTLICMLKRKKRHLISRALIFTNITPLPPLPRCRDAAAVLSHHFDVGSRKGRQKQKKVLTEINKTSLQRLPQPLRKPLEAISWPALMFGEMTATSFYIL